MILIRLALASVLVFTLAFPYSLTLRAGVRSNVALAQGIAETRALLHLDRPIYTAGKDCVRVAVIDPDENVNANLAESVVVHLRAIRSDSSGVGDQETVIAKETHTDSGVFETPACTPVQDAAPSNHDGVIQVELGDLIAAGYLDKDNPAPPQGAPKDPIAELAKFDLASDTAVVSGGAGRGDVVIKLDPSVLPPDFESTPGDSPNEPARPLAMAVPAGGFPLLFGEDQVLMAPLDGDDLLRFLNRWKGSIVAELEIPGDNKNQPDESFVLIRVDVSSVDPNDLPFLAELADAQGDTTLSSQNSARLLTMVLAERLGGTNVMLNPVPWAMSAPSTDEGGLDGMAQFTFRATRASEGIAYMDIIDANAPRSVRTAIIGGGFASPADYPSGTDNPDWGQPFNSIRQASCTTRSCNFTPGSAAGPMPMPCAGGTGGDCTWHETLAFGIAGAVGDNGFGTMGVAGHARDASGADGSVGVIDPVLFRVDTPYFGSLARAISSAVDEGVDVINISGGFACEPVLDIDLCSGATRFAIAAACGATILLFGSILPGIGALVGAAGCGAIFLLINQAGLDRRGALRAAVDRATRAGIFIAASGTETVTAPVLGTLGPWDAVDIEFLPCVLPGVTCVGAANGTVPDMINPNGRGLDIWAPVATNGTVTPNNEPDRTVFSGTSAAAPFIAGTAALMKAANPTLSGAQIEQFLRDSSSALTTPATGGCVRNSAGACTGLVDVLAALQLATGDVLSCTNFEEGSPGNDDMSLATPVTVTPSPVPGETVRVEVTDDGGIHALSADEDWFSFNLGGTPGSSYATRTDLSIGAPRFGVPSLELRNAAGGLIDTGPTVERVLAGNADHFVVVGDSGNPALDDNCYNGSTLSLEVKTKPAQDACESNETTFNTCDLADGWTGYGMLCSSRMPREYAASARRDCSGVFDDRVLGSSVSEDHANVFWEYDLSEMSLDSIGDRDFYRVPLPDPSDPAGGGFDDVSDPSSPFGPEPLEECGSYTRTGLFGTDTVTTATTLYLEIIPRANSTSAEAVSRVGEELLVYGATYTQPDPSVPLVLITCPERQGLDELVFSFGERSSARDPFGPGGYEIRMTYKVAVTRLEARPPGGFEEPIGPLPCLRLGGGIPGGDPSGSGSLPSFIPSEDFPFCGGDIGFLGPVIQLPHPFASFRGGCENGGGPDCREIFPFDWPKTGQPFDLEFVSFDALGFALLDSQGDEIARAFLDQGQFQQISGNAQEPELTQRLFLPDLQEGQYYLLVEGPEATYQLSYLAPLDDPDSDRIDAPDDNCEIIWNADQADKNQDSVGDSCQCGDPNRTGSYESADLFDLFNCLQQDPEATGTCEETIYRGDANGSGAFESADLFLIFGALQQQGGANLICGARPQ